MLSSCRSWSWYVPTFHSVRITVCFLLGLLKLIHRVCLEQMQSLRQHSQRVHYIIIQFIIPSQRSFHLSLAQEVAAAVSGAADCCSFDLNLHCCWCSRSFSYCNYYHCSVATDDYCWCYSNMAADSIQMN